MSKLQVALDSSVDKFLAEAGPLLYKNEAANNLMLGLSESMVKDPPKLLPSLIRVVEGEKTVSAALHMHPPLPNLVLTYASNDHLSVLTEYLKKQGRELSGVVGPETTAETFSKLWSKPQRHIDQKIYAASKVIAPQVKSGELKIADESDLDLVAQWLVDFTHESLPVNERRSFEETKTAIAKKVAIGWVYLWVVGGKAVSMANLGRPTKNGFSVSGVFTPKSQRKNGYASAVVAGATQTALKSGKKFCSLYAMVSDPTANKIYQDIGYREVVSSMYFLF